MTSTPRRSLAAQAVLLAVGLVLVINAAWLAVTANLNAGTLFAAISGLALLAWGFWFTRLKLLVHLIGIVLVVGVVGLSVFLASYGDGDDVRYDERAVVVLGAAVHGDDLSNTLLGRLDTALAYHQRNPSALMVVTGGEGPQENLPEAVAMRQYLLAHGVPDSDIAVEDRATSTQENFAFSKAILDARLPAGYRVAIITDEFHVYRATSIAAADHLAATHLHAVTPWYFWPADFLREDLLVLRLWLVGA